MAKVYRWRTHSFCLIDTRLHKYRLDIVEANAIVAVE